jgi:ribose 5-phosphate isomerase A
LSWREEAKKKAAEKAVEHVESGFVVGLGSGTTVAHASRLLGERVREGKLFIRGVPTSYEALLQAYQHGIPTTTLGEHPILDITIDGADQVDRNLNMIKGLGGALTREKIVATASKLNVIVVDETKLTKKLGKGQVVPLEVMPFAFSPVMAKLRGLDGKPILREAKSKLGPVVTDNGNFIVDVDFGPIDDLGKLSQILDATPGIVGTGVFMGLADIVYVGSQRGVEKLQTIRRS